MPTSTTKATFSHIATSVHLTNPAATAINAVPELSDPKELNPSTYPPQCDERQHASKVAYSPNVAAIASSILSVVRHYESVMSPLMEYSRTKIQIM